MKLWEVNHPYYCSESNYYVGGMPRIDRTGRQNWEGFTPFNHLEVESWEAFDWKDSDPDLNLLFRWDWEIPNPEEYDEGETVPPETLNLFWILQRKGNFFVTSMPVKREEEPEIRAWLQTRLKTLQAIWEPLS